MSAGVSTCRRPASLLSEASVAASAFSPLPPCRGRFPSLRNTSAVAPSIEDAGRAGCVVLQHSPDWAHNTQCYRPISSPYIAAMKRSRSCRCKRRTMHTMRQPLPAQRYSAVIVFSPIRPKLRQIIFSERRGGAPGGSAPPGVSERSEHRSLGSRVAPRSRKRTFPRNSAYRSEEIPRCLRGRRGCC